MLVALRRFMECSGVLPNIKFAYRKGLGTCDTLLCVQSALESGQEARIVQIDFSTAFVRANHHGVLHNLVLWDWRFCVVYIDQVNVKSITAPYGGRL